MKIDCHTHVLNENSYKEYMGKLKSDILFCIKLFKGYCGGVFDGRENDFDNFFENHSNLLLIESIDFETNVLSQLEELQEKIKNNKRIKGLKLYPGYQHFYPIHERLHPVYNFAKENKIPVIFHTGALYNYKNSEALLKFSHPLNVDEVAVKFPDTKFVISHFGFPYITDTALVLNKNNNVYCDISGIIDGAECYKILKSDLKRAITYYPGIISQILFGTDFIGNDTILSEINLYVKLVQELFSEKDREMIFSKNAIRLFDI